MNATYIKHLLPHRWSVRGALIRKQPFGNCTRARCLVIFIKRTEREKVVSTLKL